MVGREKILELASQFDSVLVHEDDMGEILVRKGLLPNSWVECHCSVDLSEKMMELGFFGYFTLNEEIYYLIDSTTLTSLIKNGRTNRARGGELV